MHPREERTFAISDGTEVHGWLVHDPAQQGPRPLLLDVHGGPHNAWNGAADEIHLYHQELVERGWAVLLVNPRGSDGYGEAFYDGVRGAWGVADAPDFLEPLDQLVAEGLADPARLAVAGYSYGGFMACWLTAHDDRFAAAVAGGTVSDLTSMYGTSDDLCLSAYELGGTPWEQPESLRRDVTAHPGRRRPHADAGHPRRRGPHLPARPGPAVAHRAARARRRRPSWSSTRTPRTCSSCSAGPRSGSTSTAGCSAGSSSTPPAPAARASTPRTGSTGWPGWPSGTACPGAQLGVLRFGPGSADELLEAAYGVLHVGTGAPVTTDALFQIGSITKVWTATVAMMLVDEGLLELDTPVAEVLPELRLADPDVTKSVTLRHLLNHTSGIDGDVFTDTGRGDDCLREVRRGARRGRPEPPARRDLVLLQLRLRAARPGDREGHRADLGPGAARAALHPARAGAHGDAARGGAAVRGRRRPRRARRRARPGAGLAAAALDRPGRAGHLAPSPTCWPSPGCT